MRTPQQKRLPKALSDEECRRLIGAVRILTYRACFATMYGCGLRIGEAITLRSKQIDKHRGVIQVIGKGNRERLVPLPATLLDGLRNAWRTHGNREWVFARNATNGPINRESLYRAFRAARKDANLPEATPHLFRHSYATRLLENGIRAEVVRILLGHASIRTTQTYLHLTEPTRVELQKVVGSIMRDLC